MSVINYANRVIDFKIVYYGPGMAGKTANLQYIHRSLPNSNRGKLISLATGDDRTIFFVVLPVVFGAHRAWVPDALPALHGARSGPVRRDPTAGAARRRRSGVRRGLAVR